MTKTKFAEELIKILNRQYSNHHFDGIVQRFIDQALERSGYVLVERAARIEKEK